MNKWHISSKKNFIFSLFILPFGVLSFPIFLGSYFVILLDFISQPSIDLLVGLIILSISAFPWIFGTLIIYAHIHIGFSTYKLTQNGIVIGLLKRKPLDWDKIVLCERLPFAVGRLQPYYGSKQKVVLIFSKDDTLYDCVAYAKKYGVSTLLLFQWFRLLGKSGESMVKFWLECMLQDIEVSIITPPREVIWFEYDENIINTMRQYVHIV